MTMTDNPFCERCGFRIYPQWGDHDCKEEEANATDEDLIRRIRHAAGDILANLHFYRMPPGRQVAALAEALAFAMASNIHPSRMKSKWQAVTHLIIKLINTQAMRQQKGTNSENIVMDIQRPRMKAKKVSTSTREGTHDRAGSKKTNRPHRQAVPARRTRRH